MTKVRSGPLTGRESRSPADPRTSTAISGSWTPMAQTGCRSPTSRAGMNHPTGNRFPHSRDYRACGGLDPHRRRTVQHRSNRKGLGLQEGTRRGDPLVRRRARRRSRCDRQGLHLRDERRRLRRAQGDVRSPRQPCSALARPWERQVNSVHLARKQRISEPPVAVGSVCDRGREAAPAAAYIGQKHYSARVVRRCRFARRAAAAGRSIRRGQSRH